MRRLQTATALVLCLIAGGAAAVPRDSHASKFWFEPNQGQADGSVRFIGRTRSGVLLLEERRVRFVAPDGDEMAIDFAARETTPVIEGENVLGGASNYLRGNDPSRYVTGVGHFGAVRYRGVRPGIDLVFYGNDERLEFDFIIQPGANPGNAVLAFDNVDRLRIARNGSLLANRRGRDLEIVAPVVYQEREGRREPRAGSYRIRAGHRVDFRLREYDHGQPLVIDPAVNYGTYWGGASGDYIYGSTIDSSGNFYAVGEATSAGLSTPGTYQPSLKSVCSAPDCGDALIMKVSPNGLVWSTYFGGANEDKANSVAVDSDGNVYVMGVTVGGGTAFPTTSAALVKGSTSWFNGYWLAKFNPAGSALAFSTLFGMNTNTGPGRIAVDASRNVYIAGGVSNDGLPTTPTSYKPHALGGGDGFVAKLAPDAGRVLACTYFGSSKNLDYTYGLAVDSSSNVYVSSYAGCTQNDTPTTAGAFQRVCHGSGEVVIHKFDPTLSTALFATFLGGEADDSPVGLALDLDGNVVVAGTTSSVAFPVYQPYKATKGTNGADGFITKLTSDGHALVFSTYIGGNYSDSVQGFFVNRFGDVSVVGSTSGGIPMTQPPNGAITTFSNSTDAWVAEISNAYHGLLYSSYLGGSSNEGASTVAVDDDWNTWVAGSTFSTNFAPLTANAAQPTYHGTSSAGNAFITSLHTQESQPGAIVPAAGSTIGTAVVTISGKYFHPQSTVLFDTAAATNVQVVNGQTITCTVPAHAPGLVDVSVMSPSGGVVLSGAFTFQDCGITPQAVAGASAAVCPGGSVTLNGSGGVSCSWMPRAGLSDPNACSPVATPLRTTTYYLTVTDGAGCRSANTASTTVTVNPLPAPAVSAYPLTFCPGGTRTLTAPAGYASYVWSNGATTPSIAVTSAGTYSVTVTDANGCSATSYPTPITVDNLPVPVLTSSLPSPHCPGIGYTVTAPAGYASYAWTVYGNTTTTTSNTMTLYQPATFAVRVTDYYGCTSPQSDTLAVTEYPASPVTITASANAICPGGSVTLTSSPGASYYWYRVGGSGSLGSTQSIVVTQAANYGVNVTDANGCVNFGSKTISTDTPSVTINGPATICGNTPATLTASTTAPGPLTYLWSTGATTSSISVAAGGTYNVTMTDGNGCSATASKSVTADPQLVVIVSPSGTVSDCGTNAVDLTASPSGGTGPYTYQWLRGTTVINGATASGYHSTTPAAYSVRITDSLGCTLDSAQTTWSHATGSAGVTPTSARICGSGSTTLTATYSGSAAAQSYLWSNGMTTPSISVSDPGSYSVTVTDANGCAWPSSAASVTVSPLPSPSITAGAPTTFCSGGSVTLTASGGSSYVWSTGATTPSITVSAGGSYNVTATDANGCSATSAPSIVTVNPLPVPSITAGGPTAFCAGGSVTLTAAGGTSYLWSNGATTASITVSASGSYSVTATDANGCSATSGPVTVTVAPLPDASVTASGSTTLCTGASVTLSAPAGMASYLWNTGATTRSIVVSDPGTYGVTVTSAASCSATSAPVTVVRDVTSVTISGDTTLLCPGTPLHLTSSVTDGSALSYQWYGPGGAPVSGATSATLDVVPPGSGTASYFLRVADASGCSIQSNDWTYTVDAPQAGVTPSGPTAFCSGGSVTLTANPGASYLWTSGATTQSITVSSSGTYSVSVTDANGCAAASAPTTVTVYADPAAVVSAGGPTTFCAGGSVTLTASAGTSYLWSTGATTRSIVVTSSGSYGFTLTDANGCSATSAPTTVTVNPVPSATVTPSGPTTFCAGGSVTLTASAGNSYSWSTGAVTQAITVNASGNYSVTVTNGSGCSATSAPVSVTVNANPQAVVTPNGPTTFCAGGSVTLTASPASSYLWSTGATTQSITVTQSSSYGFTVTDANGCSATSAPTTVTVNPVPSATVTPSGPTTFCAGGSVTLTAPAGNSYSWSNGATTQAITVSASGNYSVTVTNGSGCSATSAPVPVTVNTNPQAIVTPGGPTTFCAGGSVTLTASPASSYLWSTGATTQSITVTQSGSYGFTVTDANGCSATSAPTTVTVNPLPDATITPNGPTAFCPGGSVTLTAPAGNGYVWSNGATTQSITVSASGSYSVTVTNGNGCSATSAPVMVTVNANPPAVVTPNGPTTFCAGGSVILTASAGASYLWSTGATTQSITVTQSGSYGFTVTDANGCSATSAPRTVTVNANPPAVVNPSGPTTFCAGGSVTLTASPGASYLWSTGATTQSILVTQSGSYGFTVTDANGCSATSMPTVVTVNANPAAAITAGGPTTFCAGGSVTLTASAGSSYLWSTGATTQAITVSASGSYSVTVTNGSNCSATSSPTVVTVNANPSTPTITPGGPTTFCAGGSVTLNAPAGFTYTWSTGATTQAITVSASGSYSVTVRNANGCTATSAPTVVTVNTPTASITPGGPTTFCTGGSVTLTANSGTSYHWSTGATTQAITVSTSGSYTVTVTSSGGCTATSAATTVTVNTKPATPTITAGGPTTFCAGGSVTLTAPAGFTYLWSNGATTQAINATVSGSYTVTVTNAAGCSATSAGTNVTVNNAPTITAFGPTTQSVNKNGTPTTLSVTAAGTGTKTYQWYKGTSGTTTNPISGATGTSYVPPTNQRGTFTYWVRVTIGSCTANSATATVTVN